MRELAQQLISRRIYLLAVVHLAICALSYWSAFQLRFDFAVPPYGEAIFWHSLTWVILVKLVVFQCFGSLHGWWRYVTFADLASLIRASVASTLIIAAIDYFFVEIYQIPRSVLLLDWGTTLLLLGGLRSVWRLIHEHVWPSLTAEDRRPALLVGADQQGIALAWQINNRSKLDYYIVGFLDENKSHHGTRLGGIPVVGSTQDVTSLADRHDAQDVLVVADSTYGSRLRDLMERCRHASIRVKMIPPVDVLLEGSHRLQVRDINIDDLLRREPVKLDTEAIKAMLASRRVMVTGAGGSIGSEICRQILNCHPAELMLVERAENNLFQIHQELLRTGLGVKVSPCVADIRDEDRMRALFEGKRPEIVFHAAAHKHVPLMESNPGEAIANNILGTKLLTDLSDEYDVERFVLISTDKAVNPTSVMGASKHLAERYVHVRSEDSKTKFVAVRFGNVLASAGSVVPIFQDQIRRGGPITVTHPDMERYFMTIPEASQLVLEAASMGGGGEIFVLHMGEPVKIVDLAKSLIQLSGLSPEDIQIKFTGARPGEKLYEELLFDDEETLATENPKVRAARHRFHSLTEVKEAIHQVAKLIHLPEEEVRAGLAAVLPEYGPALAADVKQEDTQRDAAAPLLATSELTEADGLEKTL